MSLFNYLLLSRPGQLLFFFLTEIPYMQLPPLPLSEWYKTKMTIHLYMQIVGKIKIRMMPRRNHWWNITLYVHPKGITTGLIPYEKGCFEILFNFLEHALEITTSN